MEIQTQEAQIILAIEAIWLSKKISCCSTVKIFKVSKSTLHLRINGYTSLSERRPVSYKLTKLEEDMIIQRILNMDTRGFAPRLAGVKDIANFILKSWAEKCVGTRWA
jgi:hypothetical protein